MDNKQEIRLNFWIKEKKIATTVIIILNESEKTLIKKVYSIVDDIIKANPEYVLREIKIIT